jgi:hypothetical protein
VDGELIGMNSTTIYLSTIPQRVTTEIPRSQIACIEIRRERAWLGVVVLASAVAAFVLVGVLVHSIGNWGMR